MVRQLRFSVHEVSSLGCTVGLETGGKEQSYTGKRKRVLDLAKLN